MARLCIMVGAPGSGKSSYAKTMQEKIVSRDEIRFSLVDENEEYFSKEKEVFKRFIDEIDSYLRNGEDVIADATHLNFASRNKLLRNLKERPDSIIAVYMKTSLKECIKRNENRKGTRSYVPPEAIRNMFKSIEKPTKEEGIDIVAIIENDKLTYSF